VLKVRHHIKLPLSQLNSVEIIKSFSGNILKLNNENHQSFVKIPFNIFYKKNTTQIVFFLQNNQDLSSFVAFKTLVSNALHSKTLLRKRLLLYGLGYKVRCTKRRLVFKIGFSHQIQLKRPKDIKRLIQIKKKPKFTLESYDKIQLGNFANRVFNLKKLNSYKQKGFRFASSKKKLKPFKKK
jgi:large subunit ribosomal protein L6